MDIIKKLAQELAIKEEQAKAAYSLLTREIRFRLSPDTVKK